MEREREKTCIVQSNNCKLLLSSYESRANKVLEFRRRGVSFASVFDDFPPKTCERAQIFLLRLPYNPCPLRTCNRTSLASTECLTVSLLKVKCHYDTTRIKNNIMFTVDGKSHETTLSRGRCSFHG